DERGGLEVAFQRPGRDDVATGLDDLAEGEKLALRASAGLLLEFALCHRQRVFALQILAFRDGPGPVVFLGPERTARMHEQKLDIGAAPPEHQDAGAALGHGRFSVLPESAAVTAGCCARSSASPRAEPRRRRSRAMQARYAPPGVRDSARATAQGAGLRRDPCRPRG